MSVRTRGVSRDLAGHILLVLLSALTPLLASELVHGRMDTVLRPDGCWTAGALPNADRFLYMDYRDGSQKWVTLLTGPFLDHLRKAYEILPGRNVYVRSPSMGGMGSLRLAFKHLDVFAGLASLEPAIDPVLYCKDVLPRRRFYRPMEVLEAIFGKPIDAESASIVEADAARIHDSGLAIYLDVGDQDSFGLTEAARAIHPPPPNPLVEQLRKTLEPLRKKLQ